MAPHKFWQARNMVSASIELLEIAEFHLYHAGVRVDSGAVLTANVAPTGALGNLKDDNVATGCYWPSAGTDVILTWEFPTPQAVDGIVLASRTVAARWPTSLTLCGGGPTLGSRPNPDYTEWHAYQIPYFVSASKTPVLAPAPIVRAMPHYPPGIDVGLCGGAGYVPYQIDREVLPATTPKTYVPQRARVQISRLMDGRVIQEQWSDPVTGAGTFHNIDENFLYTITAFYPTSGMRAVVADRLQPKVYLT